MKIASNIAGGLLGALFIFFSLSFFFHLLPVPADPSPPDAPHKLFMAATFPTGFLSFVKSFELLGGLLTAIPKTRNWGLLVLGPIIVNILAFHVFLTKGAGITSPPLVLICLLAAFLLWSGRKAFLGLLN